jgi:7-cyano-7-deazaguanine reductase
MNDGVSGNDLTQLGLGSAPLPASPDEAVLETFPNSHPKREYRIRFDCPEFTSLCPITGQPDFARIDIEYVAGERCIESKSLKLYLFSFRNQGSFSEAIVNRILDDLVAAVRPRWMTVTGTFTPRGGIGIS